jgi:hypothetical protein
MKRLLMTAVAVMALVGQAAAVEMPKDLRGEWCIVPGGSGYSLEREACEQDPVMTVDRRGVQLGAEDLCYVVKVTKIDVYPWGKKPYKNTGEIIKNPWGPAYELTFRCLGMDAPATIIRERWEREKGVLMVTEKSKLEWLIQPNPPIYPKDRSQ